MRASSRAFAKDGSAAKKVVACVVTASLVAAMSYFHLGSAPEAVADDATVEVRFEVADSGIEAKVGDRTFTADSAESYEATTGADLEFSVSSADESPLAVAFWLTNGASVQAMGSKQPGAGLVTSDTSSSDESASSDEVLYAEEVVEPIAETAAVLQEKGEGEAAEETVADDATPMASGLELAATGDDPENAVRTKVTPREDGTYVIDQDVLRDAADRGAVVIVSIAATDEKPGTVGTWDELAAALAAGEAAVLSADIEGDVTPLVITGEATIDLNGHDIKATAAGESLFTVPSGANLTITDAREAAKPMELTGDDSEFNGVKMPSPIGEPERFASFVGKTASYDPAAQRLTYYITQSYTDRPSKGQTEEYLYEHVLDLSGAGSLEAAGVESLVKVEAGGTLAIEGGLVSLPEGQHAVAVNGGTVSMTGGAIVGSKGESGAAINAVNATVEIAGDAVLAGNTAEGNGNGGAVYAANSTLAVQGNALVAGNAAGSEVYKNCTDTTLAEVRNGGGIYATNKSTVTVADNAVIAGNVANADGGGIFVDAYKGNTSAASTLDIKGNVVVTNNRSENDKADLHYTSRDDANAPISWKLYGGGGGGISTGGVTTIDGAQITGNFASDGGGGIFAYLKGTAYSYPVLKIERAVVSSNYAGTSEGGGIHGKTAKESYVAKGYITNNMTNTDFDYGGGGLFLASSDHGKKSGMTIIYPLVTGNTARGFGGGVGVCTNGVAVTSDAAIFDNTALTENATTNPNEYGDLWALDPKYGLGDAAKRHEVDGVMQSEADDFFCAKQSTVFDKMLGGGRYNWSGYTTGGVFKGSIVAVREGGNSVKNELTVDTIPQAAPPNALYNIKTGQADLHIPSENGESLDFTDYLVSVTVKSKVTADFPAGTWTGVAIDCKDDGASSPKYPNFRNYKMTLDSNTRGHLTDPEGKLVLKGALKTDGSKNADGTLATMDYDMFRIASFPDTKGALAYADRLMFLKAHPTDEDKQAAYDTAVLFVTGNYSNTNGGGIGCNDRIAIGRDPEIPDVPEVPEDPKSERIAALEISKALDAFAESNGSATAVFEVVGYVDKAAADRHVADLEVYRNTVGFSFAAGENLEATRLLKDIPEGYYVVRELSYSGDNFNNDQVAKNVWAGQVTGVEVSSGDTATVVPVKVSFTNTFTDETFGTGVVNNYDQDGDGTYRWTPAEKTGSTPTEEGR